MEVPRLFFWLLILLPLDHPTTSVEYIFGYFPKDLIQVINQYTKEDLGFPSNLIDVLPDNFHPRPDFYGLPWKPVIIATYLGIAILAIFVWSTIFAVKPPVYQVNLEQISEKIKNYGKENTELVEKILNYEQKINESKKCLQETEKEDKIFSDEARKFKGNIKTLEGTDAILSDTIQRTRAVLQSERKQNVKNQDWILEQEKSIENLKHLTSINISELSEVQAALEETRVTEGKLKAELEQVQEDNAQLQTKKEQLQQKVVGYQKEHAELSELIKPIEMFEKDLEEALTQRVNDIDALINCISQLYLLSELKSEGQNPSIKELGNGKLAGDQNRKMQDQKTQMMDVSQAKTAVSAAEEDLKLLQFKLRALMSSKCNLQAYKTELEVDCNLLMVRKAAKEAECQILRMKLKILDEIYEQRKKASEEKLRLDQHERQESQRQLSALEEQGKLAAEEVRNYKKRIKEMEKQLQQVERSFQRQVALHEVKAHESWVRAHSLERRMIEATRETAYLKHRSRTCAAPLRNSSSGNSFPTEEVEESKVHRAERRPSPFPGPPFRRCPIRRPPALLVGYGPPPPPWWSPRPQPEPLPPPPLAGQAPGAGSVEAV